MGCGSSHAVSPAPEVSPSQGATWNRKLLRIADVDTHVSTSAKPLSAIDKLYAPLAPDPYGPRLLSIEKELAVSYSITRSLYALRHAFMGFLQEIDRKQRGQVDPSRAEDIITLPVGGDLEAARAQAASVSIAVDTKAPPAPTDGKRRQSALTSDQASNSDLQAGVAGTSLLEELKSGSLSAQEIQQIYTSTLAIARSPEFYLTVGEVLIQKNEPLMAEDVLYNGSKQFASHVQLQRLHALALAQGGSTERAISLLEGLRAEIGAAFDDESGGLLARCYKDLATRQKSIDRRLEYLTKAYLLYNEAYERSRQSSYYTGINTATMALLLGYNDVAKRIAAQVILLCEKECNLWGDGVPKGGYWVLATLGEASMIAGQIAEAFQYYTRAVREAQSDFVKLSSSKRQLKLLLDYVHIDEDELLASDDANVAVGGDGLLTPALRAGLMELHEWHKTHEHVTFNAMKLQDTSVVNPSSHKRLSAGNKRLSVSSMAAAGAASRVCGCEKLRASLMEALFDLPRVAVFITAEIHEGVIAAPGSQAVMASQVWNDHCVITTHFAMCPS
jgi:tetratricopeptide (TPR) repeat protein